MVPSMSMMIGAAVASSMMMASCLISAVQLARHRKETPDYTRVFLFFCAVFEQSTASIEMTGIALDIHTAERNVEMGLIHSQWSHKTTIISARRVLVVHDKLESLTFGQTTDSRCGMKSL